MFTSLMLLLDDAVEPNEKQLEQIRSYDTVIRQAADILSGRGNQLTFLEFYVLN